MPKRPHISGAEAVKALQSLGFVAQRQKGSLMRRGSAGCVVPLHREIKTGTLSGVLKKKGVTPEEFIAQL